MLVVVVGKFWEQNLSFIFAARLPRHTHTHTVTLEIGNESHFRCARVINLSCHNNTTSLFLSSLSLLIVLTTLSCVCVCVCVTIELITFFILISSAYPTIRALVGRSVGLPCNISQTKEASSIKLILWYRNNILGEPIYSIDARDKNISAARHFVGEQFRGRATFELSLASRTALLFVKPIHGDDDGQYICRVDFQWTRTTISTVRLEVIGE